MQKLEQFQKTKRIKTMTQLVETTRFTNILVWLGRMKLKKMRLKYSKRTHTHTYSYNRQIHAQGGKKNTFAFRSMSKCVWVCVFFICSRSRQAKASHYERIYKKNEMEK